MSTVSAAALAGCEEKATISANCVYTNNYYVPGAGYYHAPYRAWYAYPYNYYDPRLHQYYYGGHWGYAPMLSFTNVSSPTPASAQTVEFVRTDIPRGGFGGSSGYVGS